MLLPPGSGRGLGTPSQAPQGAGEEAATSTSHLEWPSVGAASPGLLLKSRGLCSLMGPTAQPSCGGGCQQEKLVDFGVGLFFSIPIQNARGSEETCSSQSSPSSPGWEWGGSEVTLAARKGKLKGEAERHSACPLSPLRAGSVTEMEERLARPGAGSRTSPLWLGTSMIPASRCQSQRNPRAEPVPVSLHPSGGLPPLLPSALALPLQGAPSTQQQGCANTATEGEERLQRSLFFFF